VLRYNILFSL